MPHKPVVRPCPTCTAEGLAAAATFIYDAASGKNIDPMVLSFQTK